MNSGIMDNRPILVMGICGVGKSTIAKALADRLGATFIEADAFHAPEAIARMAAGQPLSDDMRWDWLDRLGAAVRSCKRRAVLACSALARVHRDRLRRHAGPFDIVFLHGDRELIAARMRARRNHYMPVSLIDSQLATLQPPDPETENALWIDVALPVDAILTTALSALEQRHSLSGGGETR